LLAASLCCSGWFDSPERGMLDFLKTLPQAAARIQRAIALFTKASLDFVALTAEGTADSALADLLAQRTASAVDAAKAELQAKVDGLTVELDQAKTAASTRNIEAGIHADTVAAYVAALGGMGIKISDATAEAVAAELPKALQAKVAAAAAERLAESGVPAANLPPQSQGGAMAEDSIEELQKALQATKDPVEAGKIVSKIKALRVKQAKPGNN
jgi:hypothetical protein